MPEVEGDMNLKIVISSDAPELSSARIQLELENFRLVGFSSQLVYRKIGRKELNMVLLSNTSPRQETLFTIAGHIRYLCYIFAWYIENVTS